MSLYRGYPTGGAAMNNSFWRIFGAEDPSSGMPGRIDWNTIMQSWGFNPRTGAPNFRASGNNGVSNIQRIDPGYRWGGGTGSGNSGSGEGGSSGSSGGSNQEIYSQNFEGNDWSAGDSFRSWANNLFGGGGGNVAGGSSNWWSNPDLWGAVLGGASSYLDSRSANRAAERASGPQPIDRTSTSEPWDPSRNYRLTGMEEALALLQGGRNARGGGSGYRPAGFDWSNSQSIADAMRGAAMGSDPLVEQGRNALSSGLNDPYGGSALLGRTFEAANSLSDSDLNAFITNMMGGWGGAGGRDLGATGMGRGSGWTKGGGGGAKNKLIGMDKYIKELITGDYTANPELEAMIEAANRGVTNTYNSNLAGLAGMARQAGPGAGTSSAYQLADAQAAEGFTRGLAENETGIRYEDFQRWRDEVMQGMGLGTQYDLGMADVNQRASAAGAANATAREGNAIQRELGNRGILLDALGLRQGYQGMGLETMANLANTDVANRQFMLSAIPGYHDITLNDLERAFGANFGLEQSINQGRASEAARRDEASRYAANQPWNNLARYMDIINGASGGYGTQRETGMVPGNYQPQSSDWGQLLQGILGGAGLANRIWGSGSQRT